MFRLLRHSAFLCREVCCGNQFTGILEVSNRRVAEYVGRSAGCMNQSITPLATLISARFVIVAGKLAVASYPLGTAHFL